MIKTVHYKGHTIVACNNRNGDLYRATIYGPMGAYDRLIEYKTADEAITWAKEEIDLCENQIKEAMRNYD